MARIRENAQKHKALFLGVNDDDGLFGEKRKTDQFVAIVEATAKKGRWSNCDGMR